MAAVSAFADELRLPPSLGTCPRSAGGSDPSSFLSTASSLGPRACEICAFSKSCCSDVQSSSALCDPMDCSMPGFLSFTIFWSLLKLMFIELVIPYNHLVLCPPLLLPSSIFPSIRVFSNELALSIRWPKYRSFH